MTCQLRTVRVLFVGVLLVLVMLATPAWCQQEGGGFTKVGGVAGVTFVPGFTFDGITFDGETLYKEIDGDELAFLPRLHKQDLIRAMVGFHGRQGSLEISYDRTRHDGTFVDFPMTAKFQAVNVDGRFFFATRHRVQPHVLVGGSFPWLSIKDGSVLEDKIGDARWRGYGVNTEAGVTVFPHRQIGVGVGYLYRVMWFDRVTGVSDRLFELRPRFRETSGSVVVSGTVIF